MNEKLVRKFLADIESEGLSKARIEKYSYILAKISKMLGKNFEKTNENDIRELVRRIETSSYSPWTKHDYKVAIKRFYKWLRKTDDVYPKEVRWIRTTMKSKDRKLPEDILTEQEILKMINATSNMRNKAFISTLYETGSRISEIISLRIKDVVFDKNGVVVFVNGKTGSRRLRLVTSEGYLRSWINSHPFKDDPKSPLWINQVDSEKESISYRRTVDMLKRIGKKAKIKKNIYPHLFRHSRATHLAKILTEQELKQFFGWVQASEMASIYVHLSGRDLDDAILSKVYGKKQLDKEKSVLHPKICPRCEKENTPDTKICSCGLILDDKTAIDTDAKLEAIKRELMQSPKLDDIEKIIIDIIRERRNSKEIVDMTARDM